MHANIKNREKIPIYKYLTDRRAFWDGSDLSYPLSGHFTRFLIDKFGLDSFKRLFVAGLEGGFEETYGLSKSEIIKQWETFKDK